jgi:hypothetical protein
MSGTRAAWTPERRAAHAERMRARWDDPDYRARQSVSKRGWRTRRLNAARRKIERGQTGERR